MRARVAIRVDASLHIGAGHVMRCLTLAIGLRLEDFDCFFICREFPGNLIDFIRQAGFLVQVLPFAIHDSEFCNSNLQPHLFYENGWLEDSIEVLNGLSGVVDWLIVDHYYLDERWEKNVSPKCNNLMAIDDLANRSHFCTLLLDQNLGRMPRDYQNLIPAKAKLLIGPSYALIRPIFSEIRAEAILLRKRKSTISRLMVSMGGVDAENYTLKILQQLNSGSLPANCVVNVVMGAKAPWIEDVISFAKTMPWKVDVLVNISNMAELMAESDLAIGAAGSTSWERCCVGLPSFICVLADNQREVANELVAYGAAREIVFKSMAVSNLDALLEWSSDQHNLIEMSKKAQKICDGEGLARVIKTLIQSNNFRMQYE